MSARLSFIIYPNFKFYISICHTSHNCITYLSVSIYRIFVTYCSVLS